MTDSIDEALKILNAKDAIAAIEDEETYNMILLSYNKTSLIPELEKLKTAMEVFDYKSIRLCTHTLKSPSAYIGGERARRTAEIVQFNVDKQQGPQIYENYPIMIIELIKLRRAIRQYCVEKKLEGAPPAFKESDEDFEIPICSFYQVNKNSPTDFQIIQVTHPTIPQVPRFDVPPRKQPSQIPIKVPPIVTQPLQKVEPKAEIAKPSQIIQNGTKENVNPPDPIQKVKTETTTCACLIL